jgi:hypothetical protein
MLEDLCDDIMSVCARKTTRQLILLSNFEKLLHVTPEVSQRQLVTGDFLCNGPELFKGGLKDVDKFKLLPVANSRAARS